MDTWPSPGPSLETLLAREAEPSESCPEPAMCWAAGQEVGRLHFCPLCWGHSPLCLSVPIFGSFCTVPHPLLEARELLTRELGEALLIWARTRASPQAVARTQRTGKSRGRMGRTPFTWERASPAEAPGALPRATRTAGDSRQEGGKESRHSKAEVWETPGLGVGGAVRAPRGDPVPGERGEGSLTCSWRRVYCQVVTPGALSMKRRALVMRKLACGGQERHCLNATPPQGGLRL